MYDVQISDGLYKQASQAAQALQVSVDEFIEEAVQLRLQGEPMKLSPEQVAIIRQSQADIKAGKGMTLEQVKTELQQHRTDWLAANPH